MPHPPHSDRPIADPVPIDAGHLQLDAALQLLDRAGHTLTGPIGSPAWLQQLVDGLCTLSSRDPLTGLLNRRQLESALDREIDRVARAGESALLLILDIDFFKHVNDTHGHATGDLVIQTIGRTLRESVRPMDTVARIGGEEFAIMLPNCPPSVGQTVAERVRKRIELTRINLPSHKPPLCVTISIGGAFAPQWVRSSRLLWLERADRQLYCAKSAGRNRTVLELPTQPNVSAEERSLLLSDFAPLTDPPGSAMQLHETGS
jgi:diguanylate cyclase (GGDEF)-like protein